LDTELELVAFLLYCTQPSTFWLYPPFQSPAASNAVRKYTKKLGVSTERDSSFPASMACIGFPRMTAVCMIEVSLPLVGPAVS